MAFDVQRKRKPTMLQQRMIERFRVACHEDERVVAALMFGSFTVGEGVALSDIEFAVFIQDDSFETFEQRL
jgi:lincosamide nucleotidyltransferase